MSLLNDDQQTNNELARTLGRIENSLDNHSQMLTKLDHQLFGNGQPGKITVLDGRIGVLEDYRSVIKGAFAALTAIIAALGGTEVYHLVFGRR